MTITNYAKSHCWATTYVHAFSARLACPNNHQSSCSAEMCPQYNIKWKTMQYQRENVISGNAVDVIRFDHPYANLPVKSNVNNLTNIVLLINSLSNKISTSTSCQQFFCITYIFMARNKSPSFPTTIFKDNLPDQFVICLAYLILGVPGVKISLYSAGF